MIEVDGGIHQERRQADRDHNRDVALEEQRLRVLRIPNQKILDDIESVFREIARATSRWWK